MNYHQNSKQMILLDVIKKPKTWGIILILALISTVWIQCSKISSLKSNNTRLSANQDNLLRQSDQQLTLTKEELKKAVIDSTKMGRKVDSLMKVSKTRLKTVKEIVVVNVNHIDTVYVPAIRGVISFKNEKYKIPVKLITPCWGMEGDIFSKDPESTLFVSKKTSNPEIDLIKGKKGILWWKKEFYKARTSCGEINFTKIIIQ